MSHPDESPAEDLPKAPPPPSDGSGDNPTPPTSSSLSRSLTTTDEGKNSLPGSSDHVITIPSSGDDDNISAITHPSTVPGYVGVPGRTSAVAGGGLPGVAEGQETDGNEDKSPFDFLSTKRGCWLATAAVALLGILTIGLSVGLTRRPAGDSRGDDLAAPPADGPAEVPSSGVGDGQSVKAPVADEPGVVVTTATVDICNAAIPLALPALDDEARESFVAEYDMPASLVFPFQLFGYWDALCSDDERIRQMGGLQQSLATILHERFGGDVTVQNAGAFRGEFAAGPVYDADLMGLNPYNNTVSYVTVDGGGLAMMLDNAVTKAASFTNTFLFGGQYPYCSGVRFDVDVTSIDTPVTNIEVVDAATGEWTSLSDRLDDEFRVQTNSFLASGGDGYMVGVDVIQTDNTDFVLMDGLLDYLAGVDEWDISGQEMSTLSFENGL